MKEVHFNESFSLNMKESAHLKTTNLIITLISATRMRPPKMPEQFILQIEFKEGSTVETVGHDGEFRFPTKPVFIKWNNYEVTIFDMDYMAKFISLQVKRMK
jgi:hypothetical protein